MNDKLTIEDLNELIKTEKKDNMKTTENSTIEITYTQDERLIIEAKKEHYFGLGYKIEFQEIPSDIEKEGKIIFSKFKKS